MKKQKRVPFDIAYKVQMIVFGLILILFTSVHGFYLRGFEKCGRAPIIAVESAGKRGIQKITYVVDGKEYVCEYPTPSGSLGKYYYVGDSMRYVVSNPSHALPESIVFLFAFWIFELLLIGVIIHFSVVEFKRRRKVVQDRHNTYLTYKID
ncbi:MAG: hypothetical protein LBE09_02670 [Christensenellaceae bacterium]|jgi:hypothetical protein|nr:hypothetical protein [Christensenellaceae bacterium]